MLEKDRLHSYRYGTDQARSSHSMWFVKNHIEYLPLAKAMARVIGMERQMGFDRSSRTHAPQTHYEHTLEFLGEIPSFRCSQSVAVRLRMLWGKLSVDSVHNLGINICIGQVPPRTSLNKPSGFTAGFLDGL
jgi:hypothetical protein